MFERFLTFGDGPTDAIMVNNADWLDALDYIPFLRDVGTHFTINRMLTFDSVRLRLDREQPLTFLEFNYMILQAYDFLELSRRAGCRLQLGGSDQWGNIVNGIELARRIDGTELFGVTTPLITTADGAKMGKTAAGAVWLNADLLSPYDYWQFWRNTQDADVGRFLRLFTDLPLDEIARLESARRRRDQRGQDRARDRSDGAAPRRARPRRSASRDRAQDLRRRWRGRRSADAVRSAASIGIVDALTGLGFCAVEERSEAQDRRGRGAARRRAGRGPGAVIAVGDDRSSSAWQEEARAADQLTSSCQGRARGTRHCFVAPLAVTPLLISPTAWSRSNR